MDCQYAFQGSGVWDPITNHCHPPDAPICAAASEPVGETLQFEQNGSMPNEPQAAEAAAAGGWLKLTQRQIDIAAAVLVFIAILILFAA